MSLCGAIKRYMHQICFEMMKQIHLKDNKRLYQHFTDSAERWLGVISFSASWGEKCHCSFNPWLPATLPSKSEEQKEAERKEGKKKKKNYSHFFKSVGKQKAINTEHYFAIFLSTDSESKRILDLVVGMNPVWSEGWRSLHTQSKSICEYKSLRQYCVKADYSLPLLTFQECKHTVLLIKSRIGVKK